MTGFSCCAGAAWSATADLGHAAGVDFILGRCDGCGRTWMHVWPSAAPQSRYLAVAAGEAARLSALPAGPGRKRALADWLEGP